MSIIFPNIDPIALQIGPVAIRWYALAYIAGLLGGLKYIQFLVKRKFHSHQHNFTISSVDDLFSFIALGVILGGRLGYVLFYKPSHYFANPSEILKVWNGGMSFHGGLLGVIIAIAIFSRLRKIPFLMISDYVALAVPIGLFFGRIANFINAELWGRASDVWWAVQFPVAGGGYTEPRHPSQVYEALTEGLLVFVILQFFLFKTSLFQQHGKIAGIFLVGYGVSRIFCEFFREPDTFLGFISHTGTIGITQGMILSVPMILVGIFLILRKQKIDA